MAFERVNSTYTGGNGQPWHQNWAGYSNDALDFAVRAGSYGNPSAPTYFGTAFLPGDKQYIPDFNKSINTPLGQLNLESNYEYPNVLSADFTPKANAQVAAQVLQKLLGR